MLAYHGDSPMAEVGIEYAVPNLKLLSGTTFFWFPVMADKISLRNTASNVLEGLPQILTCIYHANASSLG